MTEKGLQKKIGFNPHWAQKEILKCKEREIVICAGRRFGKSMLCAYIALRTLLEGDLKGKPVKIWIVSPSYELSKKVFEYLVIWFMKTSPSQSKGVSYRPFPQIKTARGSIVQCKSADAPTGLLGEELDLLIVDECSRIKKNVYQTYLYPTTISREGCRTFFISTPFGKNWFYEQWIRAKEQNAAFQFTTRDNPTIENIEQEWNMAKLKLPDEVFQQEFQAVFGDSAALVFKGIRNCIRETLREPRGSDRYIMGLDLAKFRDFSVITIVDKNTHEVVYWDRFQKIPYTLQKQRIIDVARKYNTLIVIDSLNVGAALGDELRAEGLRVQDFKSTGSISKDWGKKGSKERLIEKLSSFIGDINIHFPANEVLIDELEAYTYQLSDSGNIKYGAPTGLHDDCVISLALAVWSLYGKVKHKNIKAKRSVTRKIRKFEYD